METHKEICGCCNGSGQGRVVESTCPFCKGSGELTFDEEGQEVHPEEDWDSLAMDMGE